MGPAGARGPAVRAGDRRAGSLEVFSIRGQRVTTVNQSPQARPGARAETWVGRPYPGGVGPSKLRGRKVRGEAGQVPLGQAVSQKASQPATREPAVGLSDPPQLGERRGR